MKTCPGCGAFFNNKCQYCGYQSTTPKEAPTYEFVNLHVKGDMNNISIKYGKQTKDNIFITGDMQNTNVVAERVNLIVTGNMNNISVSRKVNLVPLIKGDMNNVRSSLW